VRALAVLLALGVAADVAAAQPPSMTPLSDDKIKFAPIVVPRETKRDLRPIYVGAGLVLVAAGLWWNRKQRARLDSSDKEDKP
jgi:hypothetical protein